MSLPKKKVVFISDEYPPFSYGGAALACQREYEAVVKRDLFEVFLLTFHNELNEDALVSEKYLFAKQHGRIASIFQTWKVIRHLRHIKPDLVHLHHVTSRFGILCAYLIARQYPTIVSVHDATWISQEKPKVLPGSRYFPGWYKVLRVHRWRWRPFLRYAAKKVFTRTGRIIFVSDALRQVYVSCMPLDLHAKFITLRNGLDLEAWQPAVRSSTENGVIKIGFAGRPTVDKGWRIFFQLIKELSDRGVEAYGHVVGDGRVEEELRSAPTLERSRVIFDGLKSSSEVYKQWLCGIDIMFAGSLYIDPFPNTVIESLAMGVPVIIGPYTGSGEIMDSDCGVVMSKEDTEDPSLVAERLVSGDGLEAKITQWKSRIAAPEVRARFDMRTHVNKLVELYRGTIKN